MNNHLPSTKILGTTITTASKKEILEYIFNVIQEKQEKIYIVTPNPEILVHATRSRSFQNVLNDAQVSLPDGVGLLLADKMLKKGLEERITGTDMMVEICHQSAVQGFTVGFLGGRDGVAELTAECLKKKYPQLRVLFASGEWKANKTEYRSSNIEYGDRKDSRFNIQDSKFHIDILFVAFGAPKQEEWIAANLKDLPVTVAMGVGGAFDYVSGKVPRAPKVIRDAGLEWAFRLACQPWRIKRQLALPVFVWKVLAEKYSTKQP